jgi:hypothetical protein
MCVSVGNQDAPEAVGRIPIDVGPPGGGYPLLGNDSSESLHFHALNRVEHETSHNYISAILRLDLSYCGRAFGSVVRF